MGAHSREKKVINLMIVYVVVKMLLQNEMKRIVMIYLL